MFETRTYEKLMEEVLATAPKGIDTRKGSIFFDAVSATVNKIAKLYTDLDHIFSLIFITTAQGEYLDLRGQEFGLTRLGARPAKYLFEYTGTRPPVGWRFFHNDSGYYFLLREAQEDGTLYLEAETDGEECNYIQVGDIAVPVNTVSGMATANFAGIYEYGSNAEDDENLRERIMEKIAGPAENGNKQHYKSWCESISGVGLARIEPLWNGENTVRAILISPLGLPVSEGVSEAVQQYIDPNGLKMTVTINGKTYRVGDGLGNGRANIGAHFTAVAAEARTINVTFEAELTRGRTAEMAEEAVSEAVTEYLKGLVLEAEEDEPVVVRISAIGAILAGLTSYIVDYHDLALNGSAENIRTGNEEVPVLGEVTAYVLP